MHKLLALLLLAAIPAYAEEEFPEINSYGNWEVYTDGDVCWVSSFSIYPDFGDGSPRMFVTFYNKQDKGDLAVYDIAKFKGSEIIAIALGDEFYPLDSNQEDPSWAHDNTFGLMEALKTKNFASVAFMGKTGKEENYKFSLDGFNQAAQQARYDCKKEA
jgi:hypothetical protein